MAEDKEKKTPPQSAPPAFNVEEDYQELGKAGKKGFFGRFSSRFDEALQTGRGPERQRNAVSEMAGPTPASADDIAIRRARNVSPAKMVIPEGVIIEGSLTGGSETEIGGRIEGNITVDGSLYLAASALVSGNVRAGSARVEGLVEGKIECSQDVGLGTTGRLNGDVIAGRRVTIEGEVHGDIATPGLLRLVAGAKVKGNLRTRRLVIEDGAALNGHCTMRAPAQRNEKKPQ